MTYIRAIQKYVIESQIYVALMGTLFASFFMLEKGTFRFPTFFLIFITYFSGYIYTKYQGRDFFRKILLINCLAGIICIVLIIHNHNIERLYKWLIIVVLGLLYNSSFLSRTIRTIPFLKVFYVGFVWALVNSWLSFQYFNFPIFWISLLFVTALVLPFDIRDLGNDDVLTIPKYIGIQKTKLLAFVLVITACLLSGIYLQFKYTLAFYLTASVTLVLIAFTKKTHHDLYFSFLVESCSGLPLFFLVLAQLLLH